MPDAQASTSVLFALQAFLVPSGLALLAIGASREEHAEHVATTALLALAAACMGYLACGFAVQFGGVAFVSGMPGLRTLTAEWSPLDLAWGPGWGLVGLRGFLLRGDAYTTDVYLLFATQLAAVTTATLVALLAICGRAKRMVQLALGLLVSGVVYPLFGNWLWGGGWLSNLGSSLGLGHGFVDAAGSGAIFVLGALVAQAAFLAIKPGRVTDQSPARLPSVHFPLWMVVGALMAVAGWPGLALGNVLIQTRVSTPLVLVNLMMGATGGALITSLYSWFVTAQPDGLAVARGTVAALVAVSAACPFVPAWAALAIGAVAGMLFILGLYASEHVLRVEDPSASAATFGLPGLWGLLAVAVFADGRWGAGWNGVGAESYLGIARQGISGFLVGPGFQSPGSGQLYAQLTGIAALLVAAFVLPWIIFQGAVWIRRLGKPRQPEQSVSATVPSALGLGSSGGDSDKPSADSPEAGTASEVTDSD
jgi:Amt family ammonium transporter